MLTKGIATLQVNLMSRLNVNSQVDCFIVRLLDILELAIGTEL